jgi:molybdopterin molybdotransferase
MLTMIDPRQALDLVLVNAHRLPCSQVPLEQAQGLTLAQIIRADRDYPPFDRAAMDGYAVRLADAGGEVLLAGEVAAGQTPSREVTAGRCVAMMTGAPCPAGTEAVVKLEDAPREGQVVRLPAGIAAGQHVAPRGCEVRQGQVVLEEGSPITPLAVAVLASVGRRQVQATDLPRVAVVGTGSELVPVGERPGPAQIRASNGAMVAAQVRRTGLPPARVLSAGDTLESLARALDQATEAQIVVLTGGVSTGRYDLVPEALTGAGATVVFHGVNQTPGKPLLFATRERQLLFGLPGSPLGSHFCFHRYVAPAARQMAGLPPTEPAREGRLTAALEPHGARTTFVLARVTPRHSGFEVTPLRGQGPGGVFAGPGANAYLVLEPGTPRLAAGQPVRFEWIGGPR